MSERRRDLSGCPPGCSPGRPSGSGLAFAAFAALAAPVWIAACPASAPWSGGAIPALTGTVSFGREAGVAGAGSREDAGDRRTVAATTADIAAAATVSLIDPGTAATIATTLTRPDRTYSLDIRRFSPRIQTYYVEAVKGLKSNAVGHDVVRLRTIVRWGGDGWAALTAGDASLGVSTTALSAIVALRSGVQPVDPAGLIGKLDLHATDPFAQEGTGVSQTEFDSVRALVGDSLAADRDPLEALTFDGLAFRLRPATGGLPGPYILGIVPDPVEADGSFGVKGGFFRVPAIDNTVTLDGRPVALEAGSADYLGLRLPPGSRSGVLAVANAGGLATVSLTVLQRVHGGLIGPASMSLPAAGPGKDVTGTLGGLGALSQSRGSRN